MKLTLDSIQKAMTCPYPAKGDEFYLDPKGENAQIIDEAARRGYIRRYSTTQVEWTEEGLKRARQELAEPKTVAIDEVKLLLVRRAWADLAAGGEAGSPFNAGLMSLQDEILARLAKLQE